MISDGVPVSISSILSRAVHDAEQATLAAESKSALEAERVYAMPIRTEIRAATTFWPAEDYHQQYIAKGGEHHCHVFTRPVAFPA